jgi:hypothetical protein
MYIRVHVACDIRSMWIKGANMAKMVAMQITTRHIATIATAAAVMVFGGCAGSGTSRLKPVNGGHTSVTSYDPHNPPKVGVAKTTTTEPMAVSLLPNDDRCMVDAFGGNPNASTTTLIPGCEPIRVDR